MILTLTAPNDVHAFYVREALRRKGSDTLLWFTTDLAQLGDASIEVDADRGLSWSVEGPGLALDSATPRTVWFRRGGAPVVTDALHPADRKFAHREYEELLAWLLALLPADAFEVNAPERARRASSKVYQQQVARRAGLSVPTTLYSNDPERIRGFLRRQGGRAAFKALTQPGTWKLADNARAVPFTVLLTEDQLPEDDVLKATPGIYQAWVPKQYELRVTVIGRYVFPAKIDSQATRRGRIDWRRAPDELICEPVEVPEAVRRGIVQLMDEMGLVFGALDLIVTPDGEHIFLEVNEMGQFLFVEQVAGIPLLDAFCEMLIQGRADFDWQASRATVSTAELEDVVMAQQEQAAASHVPPPDAVAGVETDEAAAEQQPT